MNLMDTADLHGEVLITATSESGTTVLVDDKNLIVLNGRRILANQIKSGGNTYITGIEFGVGGVMGGDPNNVISPSPDETAVITKIPNLVLNTDYTFSSSLNEAPGVRPKIIYTINIPTGTVGVGLNGKAINELALMMNTTVPSCFALKRFPNIIKSVSVALNISWTIYF